MAGILKLFARSPFGPMLAHMEAVMACVRQVEPLFAALPRGAAELATVSAEIDRLEAQADQAKNEIRDHLPRALFLPVDRRDLLDVVHMQDSMADSLQEAADLLNLRPLTVPAGLAGDLRQFVADVLATCEAAAAIMSSLSELVETGFGGPEAARVMVLIEALDDADSKSDRMERTVLRRLFELEADLGAVDLMLWYQVLRKTGEIANYAERTGNRLRLLLAKV